MAKTVNTSEKICKNFKIPKTDKAAQTVRISKTPQSSGNWC